MSTIRDRVGTWAKKAFEIRDMHKQNPMGAWALLLGEERTHKLFNSSAGEFLLATNENNFIFAPDFEFLKINHPDGKGVDTDDPAAHGLPGYQKIMLEGPRRLRQGNETREQYLAWYKPPADNSKPVVAYFHGSAGPLAVRTPVLAELAKSRRGCGVMIVAYPGFKGSKRDSMGYSQKPSVKGCYHAGEAMVEWLHKKHPDNKLIYFGESLGGHVAVHTAGALKHIVPELIGGINTLYGLGPWIKDHFDRVDTDCLTHDFNSGDIIGKITKSPILLMHGTDDTFTFPRQSEMLKEKSDADKAARGETKNVTYVPLEGVNHRISRCKPLEKSGEAIVKESENPLQPEEVIDPRHVAHIITQMQDFLTINGSDKAIPTMREP